MATKLKHQAHAAPDANQPVKNNVVAMPERCKADGCKKAGVQMSFCAEHYDWFKFGLITKEGKRPSDFDKKFTAYQKHHKKAA